MSWGKASINAFAIAALSKAYLCLQIANGHTVEGVVEDTAPLPAKCQVLSTCCCQVGPQAGVSLTEPDLRKPRTALLEYQARTLTEADGCSLSLEREREYNASDSQ